ncbi:MAG: NAD(P)H-hydrate dehydratase [Planctomycetota bacterium]|jgi:NAD(P)H-hydrate epimerase
MPEASLPSLPPRPADGHKGTFGTVCVLGGQGAGPRVMVGGPAFAALGALRTGTGLAVLAVPAPLMAAGLTVAPSATGLALPVDKAGRLDPSGVAEMLDRYVAEFDCLAVGPGLGDDEPQRRIMARLITREDVPLVIDADALNALAGVPDFGRDLKAQAVLTPHPGEYRRLAATLGIDADPAQADLRPDAAAQLARRLGCVVVLKGAGTVVSDGINTWTNASGNVALATAGTGDVLTGVIAGLVAQHAGTGGLSLYDCARLGVHAHGLAADRWSTGHGDTGLLAGELLDELPGVMAELRAGK